MALNRHARLSGALAKALALEEAWRLEAEKRIPEMQDQFARLKKEHKLALAMHPVHIEALKTDLAATVAVLRQHEIQIDPGLDPRRSSPICATASVNACRTRLASWSVSQHRWGRRGSLALMSRDRKTPQVVTQYSPARYNSAGTAPGSMEGLWACTGSSREARMHRFWTLAVGNRALEPFS